MTAMIDFDRLVATWLESDGPVEVRTSVVDEALTTARQRRQRRQIGGWTMGASSWPSGRAAWRPVGAMRTALVILLVAAVGAGAVIVGRELLRRQDPLPRELRGALTTRVILTGLRAGPSAIALSDGRLAVPGDAGDGSIAEIVDLASGRSEPVRGDGLPFTPTGASELRDGSILVIGVSDNRGIARVVDPATAHVVSIVPMTAARYEPAIARLADGRVLVSGGQTSNEHPESLTSAEVYDPAIGAFEPTSPMSVARSGHALTTLDDGQVLVSGWTLEERWVTRDGKAEQRSSRDLDLELYDPGRGVFERVDVLDPAARRGSSVAPIRLADGRVLIFLGQDGQFCGRHGTDPIATSVFDPVSRTVSPGHRIPHDITTAAALPDGRVVVTGVWTYLTCWEDSEYVRDAWIGIHDPVTGVTLESRDPRTGVASLSADTDRGYLSAVTLSDGRVALVSDGGLYGLNGGEPDPQVVDVFE